MVRMEATKERNNSGVKMSAENGMPMDVPRNLLEGVVSAKSVAEFMAPKLPSIADLMGETKMKQRIADLSTSENRLIKAVTYCVDCCKALEFEMGPWLNGEATNLDMRDTFYRRLGTILDGFPSVLEEANKQTNGLGEG